MNLVLMSVIEQQVALTYGEQDRGKDKETKGNPPPTQQCLMWQRLQM